MVGFAQEPSAPPSSPPRVFWRCRLIGCCRCAESCYICNAFRQCRPLWCCRCAWFCYICSGSSLKRPSVPSSFPHFFLNASVALFISVPLKTFPCPFSPSHNGLSISLLSRSLCQAFWGQRPIRDRLVFRDLASGVSPNCQNTVLFFCCLSASRGAGREPLWRARGRSLRRRP